MSIFTKSISPWPCSPGMNCMPQQSEIEKMMNPPLKRGVYEISKLMHMRHALVYDEIVDSGLPVWTGRQKTGCFQKLTSYHMKGINDRSGRHHEWQQALCDQWRELLALCIQVSINYMCMNGRMFLLILLSSPPLLPDIKPTGQILILCDTYTNTWDCQHDLESNL